MTTECKSLWCAQRRVEIEPDWYPSTAGFERAVVFVPGYRCNCHGQHGTEIRWYLRGDIGVAQFVVYTDWPPADLCTLRSGARMFPMAADLGFHDRRYQPLYADEEPYQCPLVDGYCYYDGSSLAARPVLERFYVHGETAIWQALASEYERRHAN